MGTRREKRRALRGRAPLKNLTLPPVHRSRLANGLEVLVMKHGAVPLFTARLIFRSGSASDPPGKFGLADFTAQLLRRGAGELSADQIDEAIEFVGGSLSVGAGEDALTLELSAPREELDAMLAVLAQLVQAPLFPQQDVESARVRTLAQLANDLDDPALVADRALSRSIWGNHPYSHDVVGTKADVATFSQADVRQFHSERFGPKGGMIAIVGAVSPQKAAAAVDKHFSRWIGADWVGPSLERLPMRRQTSVLLVDKPDATQSQIRMGCLSLTKGDPDYIPAIVMNQALGGGFTSRLVTEIRVKRGLSYGASSHFDSLVGGGTFSLSTFTKNETARQIIQVALKEVRRMRSTGPTVREIEAAKTFLAGLYPATAESNDSIAGKLSDIWLNGLRQDWIQTYRARVGQVSLEAAKRVAREYLFSELPDLVVVGQASAVRAQISRFGEVLEQPITGFE